MRTILILLLSSPLIATAATATATALPERLDPEGFNQVLALTGDVFIAGQPTVEGLARMHEAGVTTVINLRTAMEMDNREVVPFDEAARVEEFGMAYVHVPAGGPDTPYSPDMIDAVAAALADAEGKVLLHCTVAWRASHLWTAYLTRYRGLTLDEAVEHGRAINLGTLPLEGFLGEPIRISVSEQ